MTVELRHGDTVLWTVLADEAVRRGIDPFLTAGEITSGWRTVSQGSHSFGFFQNPSCFSVSIV